METINIIGGGLAGAEAAYQITKRGLKVRLYEMRGVKNTEAHQTTDFAELVCSNSLRANTLTNAVGVLKEEMRMLDSLIIRVADETKVPAGGALAVDREGFSKRVTEIIRSNPLIEVINEEVTEIPEGLTIIATGPLTSKPLADAIQKAVGEDYFHFFDAAAPIVTAESIDFSKAYKKSRYDKGEADYINCPMTKEEYDLWHHELIHAETVVLKDFELKVFEGCMPFEIMAKRGNQTLLFGPMKPVGLEHEGNRPYAVVQLRQDDAVASLYNIVGFQTNLKFKEQKRIIQMIPGLEQAEIVRYGVMHQNMYLNAPKVLKPTYQSNLRDDLFFAGQITGVEGYVESAASGLLAGLNAAHYLLGEELVTFPNTTIIGSMAAYISNGAITNLQPMNANFGILPELGFKHKKKERKELYAERALNIIKEYV